jgi:hypothetical protein
LKTSLEPLTSSNDVELRLVGSLDLGTMYSVRTDDHTLDIVIWNTFITDQIEFMHEMARVFLLRNSEIKRIGDSESVKDTYINRRYPTMRAYD